MTLPDWRASTAGARNRVALWLHAEVGVGGVFTKSQLRDAFPGVEQIDRRMRDLRAEGWVFLTYQEDRSLAMDELRLMREGGQVWEKGYRSQQTPTATAKERRATFAADNYACVYCGISGGEPYPDDPVRVAKLTLARVQASEDRARPLVTACDRCHVAISVAPEDDDLFAALNELDEEERSLLRSWMRQGTRQRSAVEQLWGRYRRLPREARLALEEHLRIHEAD